MTAHHFRGDHEALEAHLRVCGYRQWHPVRHPGRVDQQWG